MGQNAFLESQAKKGTQGTAFMTQKPLHSGALKNTETDWLLLCGNMTSGTTPHNAEISRRTMQNTGNGRNAVGWIDLLYEL